MATEGALGKRRFMALARIEHKSEALSGGRKVNLPHYSRYGNETLLVLQLESLADFLEGLPDTNEAFDALEALSVSKLKTLAKDRGIAIKPDATKDHLLALLKTAG